MEIKHEQQNNKHILEMIWALLVRTQALWEEMQSALAINTFLSGMLYGETTPRVRRDLNIAKLEIGSRKW